MTTSPEFSLAEVHEAIAASRPDADCLVFRDHRYSWAEITERTRRLANHLISAGLGVHTERADLAGHESGQDHLAIYLHNGNEYLESMLGALKARVASLNVNYRYVAEELLYLLNDSQASAVVVHSAFTPTLAEVLDRLPNLRVILQVPDESGHPLLPGAVWYEDALAAASPERPDVEWSPDDLYMLYTGGTTGMPKGVMWRNGDAMVECFGGSKTATSIEEFVAEANTGLQALLAPPFMHGAGHWMSFRTWLGGGTVFVQSVPERLDPVDIWSMIDREQVNFLLIVGDAFARPLLDELDHPTNGQRYDLSSLTVVLSGGAPLSAPLKDEFLTHLPTLMIVDGLGSSEAGGQVSQVSTGGGATTGTFEITPGNVVLSADLDRVLEAGDPEIGWLAKSGRLALGYLGDPTRRRARIQSSMACATRFLATVPACSMAASSSCTGATRSRSTPVARRSSLRRSRQRSSRTLACTTASWPAGRASAGATRSSPSCESGMATRSTTRPCAPQRRNTSLDTSCPRKSDTSTRSCDRRAARPTTGGPSRLPLNP